jgi:hypothetical protein
VPLVVVVARGGYEPEPAPAALAAAGGDVIRLFPDFTEVFPARTNLANVT